MIKKIESYPELADPQLRPRYSGIPTFFRTPHTTGLAGVDIGLVGVPFDGGVTNRTGARHGPRDIRNHSSLVRKINQATGVAPFDLVRVADLGDAWIIGSATPAPCVPWAALARHCRTGAFQPLPDILLVGGGLF